jgi:Spy/CpxP family protein refolding chaperone
MTRPNSILTSLSTATLALALFAGAGTAGTAILGTAPAAGAQEVQSQSQSQGPGGGHGQRMGQILMSLNLSDAQKARIKAIVAEARKQNQGVEDRAVKRANMKKAYDQVATVLTPAQAKEFHAKMDAMRKQWQSQQQGGH